MCGIAGILRIHPPGQAPPPPWVAIPEAWLDILDESVKHRGPDGHGRFRDRAVRPDGSVVDVAFVHRRLSIIDHAGGHQPMVLRGTGLPAGRAFSQDTGHKPGATPDAEAYRRTAEHALNPCPRCAALGRGTIAVVFNGCIYNHRELRKELQAAGHEFSTDHSDTEVLVHGWGEWSERSFRKLEGMFGGGVWDSAAGALMTFRDQCGEKPLYLAQTTGGTDLHAAFASTYAGVATVRARWAVPYERQVSPPALRSWLRFGYATEPLYDTCLEAPAFAFSSAASTGLECAEFDLAEFPDEIDSGRFGRFSPPRDTPIAPEGLDALLRRAVVSRLESDVPLGCFLSGGVDSSLVSLYAKEQLPSLQTFTVRMPVHEYDESAYAAAVAVRLGTRHSTLECDAAPAHDLPRLIRQLGLPFGDSSLLPTYWVSRAARSLVSVALSGDGGDELFAGYDRYRAAGWIGVLGGRLGAGLRPVAPAVGAGGDPKSRASRALRFLAAMTQGGYDDLIAVFPEPSLRRLGLGPRERQPLGPRPVLFGRRAIDDAILHDLLWYLPGDLLRKSDTASMTVALEVRAPFLDRALVDAALRAPIQDLMPRGQRKGLLRAVARKYFPPEIVDRPKQGFAIPIGEWFRSDYGGMRQLLLDHLNGPEPFGPDSLGINGMIKMDFVKQMLREHDDAGVKSIWPWKGRDHSQRLYMLLVLSIWAKWLGGL